MEIIAEGIGLMCLLGAAFALGRSTAHSRLADEWERIEKEWYDLNVEKMKWQGTRSRIS